ncbi:MAG: hypothetical protein ACTJHY_11035, partial [Alcaligenes pakistanensis]
ALDTGSIPVGRARILCLYVPLGTFFKTWALFLVTAHSEKSSRMAAFFVSVVCRGAFLRLF